MGSFPETFMLGSGKRDPNTAFALILQENPAIRTSVIAIPNIVSFPTPHPVPTFWRIPLPGSRQIPYPVNVSGITHCILVKSRISGKFFQILLCLKRPCYVKTCHYVNTKYPPRAFFLGPSSGDWMAIST